MTPIKRILIISTVFLWVAISLTGCSNEKSLDARMTFRAECRDFAVTVEALGVVEAVRNLVLSGPRIRGGDMEISSLALEGSFVKKGEVVVRLAADRFETEFENATRALELSRSDVRSLDARHEQAREQIKSNILNARASAESARLQLARLDFVSPGEREIRKLEIEKSERQAEKSRRKLSYLNDVQREERNQAMLKVKQAMSRLELAEENLEKLVLRSPVDGYVLYETSWVTHQKVREGDRIYRGMPIVKIPDMSAMQVKMQLSETEVQGLKQGQPAIITVPSLVNVSLKGSVSSVAKIAKPVIRRSEVKRVEVMVEIDSLCQGLVPGLSASCNIEKEKVPGAVTIPLDCVFERDSVHVVYVRNKERFSPRLVVLGVRGNNFAVVDSGLSGGEELALLEPAYSQRAQQPEAGPND